MSDFFSAFSKVSKTDWEAKLISDLKGKDPSLLLIDDPIEELTTAGYKHSEDTSSLNSSPGNFPFVRGFDKGNNDWNNGALIEISNEQKANNLALQSLSDGANLLVFKSKLDSTNWQKVLEGIQLEYIFTQFIIKDESELEAIQNEVKISNRNVQYNIDFLSGIWTLENLAKISQTFKSTGQIFCSVPSFKIQRCGATTWQEIGFALNVGHEYLIQLINAGFNIDEASAAIGFQMGIGSNYFNEMAKFRAFRLLWSKIIAAYSPEHSCSHNCNITAVTGFLNKSLKDPYTNILRQTTEGMSAINAGVDALVILPYDSKSQNGSSELASRMALNISTILKEESYLDIVQDPVGGSYSLESITEIIGKKAWSYFQTLESLGGIIGKEGKDRLVNDVTIKRQLRIEKYSNGERVAIGINKYPSNESNGEKWSIPDKYLDLIELIIENEIVLSEA